MRNLLLLTVFVLLYSLVSYSQQYYYSDNYTEQGFEVLQSTPEKIRMEASVNAWTLSNISVNRELLQKIELPGHFLPNDEGMPDLPGSGRYIAIPQGASASLRIIRMQTETLQNIELAPAPRIPKTTENGPLFYAKNQSVYNTNSLYPANPVSLSAPTQVRGVDVVMIGITPFQYNPVSKELVVIRDIEIEVVFEGGNGQFGDTRLRSRWWEPLLADMLVNFEQLSTPTLTPSPNWGRDGEGAEYLIICPDDPEFLAWADTIRIFRNKQGINTGIVTTTEMGGNTVTAIRNYINNAYNTWDIPPAAILILGDYGTSGSTVVSPIWDNYCASDNIFGDVNNDDLPDIVMSRIMAQNATHLETMITKFIGYETNPPVNPDYYAHPVTALGWQTERWFQVCIEVVGGFFRNVLDKDPIRVNAVYDGNPSVDPWSTAPNTGTIMNYFGPNGLGYIPSSPSALGGWSGGTSNQINAAINSGSFLLLHRDHGYEQGWGEPAYSNSSLSGLDNEDLTFVYSVNCLTGKFNYGSECFAEAFYRHPQRALGIIAASEVSYSFVNDTYVWGAFDNMWPEFMPDYGTNPESRGHLPAFSNAAGKFFLQQSGWPYNTGNKEVTYHLFHHFGDAFSSIYSEVPQELLVIHNDVLIGGSSAFTIQADSGSFIALSVEGEIIGVADGTSQPVSISIAAQLPGAIVDVVVTKTNHFRYEAEVLVISPNSPYVVYSDHLVNDQDENGDGLMDYAEDIMLNLTLHNIGSVDAENVNVIISSDDPYLLIPDSAEFAGYIAGNSIVSLTNGFLISVSDTIPDNRTVFFTVECENGDSSWYSEFYITSHAPVLDFTGFTIDDEDGNNNGCIDPGESALIIIDIQNNGSSSAYNVTTGISCPDDYLNIMTGEQNAGVLDPGEATTLQFQVYADPNTPGGFNSIIEIQIEADHNRQGAGSFTTVIGQYSALILDLDPGNHSAPLIAQSFSDMDLIAEYTTAFPSDLKQYKSIFLSLGIYYSSHELTESESDILTAYLEDGGKLYMEGRLTWFMDLQTNLHEMFNINTEEVNWYEYDSITGLPGTFTEGLGFDYDMTQPYNNYYLVAEEPAYELMNSLPASTAVMVAYDAGVYKTVGSSAEFGGLVDGIHPSTKDELLSQILEFFGDIITRTEEHPSENEISAINVYPNPFHDIVYFDIKLNKTEMVKLEITDITGRTLSKLFEGKMEAGNHNLSWDASVLPNHSGNGIYFFRFIYGNEIQVGKLILTE
jgi:hypothetical protein